MRSENNAKRCENDSLNEKSNNDSGVPNPIIGSHCISGGLINGQGSKISMIEYDGRLSYERYKNKTIPKKELYIGILLSSMSIFLYNYMMMFETNFRTLDIGGRLVFYAMVLSTFISGLFFIFFWGHRYNSLYNETTTS